jgi:hypothetical protein
MNERWKYQQFMIAYGRCNILFFYRKPWGKTAKASVKLFFINRKEFTATLLTSNEQVIYSLDKQTANPHGAQNDERCRVTTHNAAGHGTYSSHPPSKNESNPPKEILVIYSIWEIKWFHTFSSSPISQQSPQKSQGWHGRCLRFFFSLKKLVDACDFILFIYFERNSREDPYFFFCFLY